MLKTIATIAFFILLGSAAPQAQQAPLQPSPVKRTILQKADVPGTNLEVIYATVEIAPGFKAAAIRTQASSWRSRRGELVRRGWSARKIFKAGEALTVPDRAIHNEGATDKGVKLNAVYVVEKGQPLASPAK